MENITNMYEALVLSEIYRLLRGRNEIDDEDFIADVACVALNNLPARYVRHLVDTRFFETKEETDKSTILVASAVNYAIQYIDGRSGLGPDGSSR